MHHIIGAVLGLVGTVLLFAGKPPASRRAQLPGLVAAFIAAFVWATYSVLSRRLKAVPTDAVAGFCLATALLAALMHGLLETTVWPETTLQWLAVIALGIGPVGAAFYAWDIGMKRGDIRVLGAASYATPLLSTGFLIAAGFAKASANIAHRRNPDRRRRPDRGEGHGAAEAVTVIAGSPQRARSSALRLPAFRRELEFRELECGRHGAADQRPVAGALRRLPGIRRHDRLRPLAAARSVPSRTSCCDAAVMGDAAASAGCRRNSARSRPHRCDASASARRAPAGNRSGSSASGHWRRGLIAKRLAIVAAFGMRRGARGAR